VDAHCKVRRRSTLNGRVKSDGVSFAKSYGVAVGPRWRSAGAASLAIIAPCVASCGSGSSLGLERDGPAGASGHAGLGGESSGGADGSGASRSTGGSGGKSQGGGGAGGALADGGTPPAGEPSGCVSKKDLPRSCDEVCLDQGKPCADDCDFGTFLPARAAYYPDLRSCESDTGVVFTETAQCGDVFDEVGFIPWTAVRCCCGQSDFVVATAAEKTPLCDAACKKDPYPPEPDCSFDGTSCSELCLGATRGADAACAACVISGVAFSPSYCGTWECTCGGPTFGNEWTRGCDDACGPTRQHERDLYAEKPRPAPVGHAPSLQVDAPDGLGVTELYVDAEDRLWAVGHVIENGSQRKLAVVRFDAELNVVWRWVDPQARALSSSGFMARLGAQMVVMVDVAEGAAPLVFFDADGFVREVPTSIHSPTSLLSLGNGLLVKYPDVPGFALAVIDEAGATRFTAPKPTFDGVTNFWVHSTNESGAWTLASGLDDGLFWRRVIVSSPPVPAAETADIAWTHRFAIAPSWRAPLSVSGSAPAGKDDALAWGARIQERGSIDGSFPWIARLGDADAPRWQWSNGDLVTPGTVNDAVQTADGVACTAGQESWRDSTEDRPASGPVCSPDGCDALTVRCFDAQGTQLWKYHHRSETSEAHAIAANSKGQLFVAGSTSRDPRFSTGTRLVLLRFEL
jgi:hypothetical protein